MSDSRQRPRPSFGLAWLGALFRAAFAEQPTVSRGAYLGCNLAAGLVLLVIAALMLSDPKLGGAANAIGLSLGGLTLTGGVLIPRSGPNTLPRVLTLHGFVFALLALVLTISSLHWALSAPAESPFRYAPGLILVLATYSALLLAVFGPWPRHSRRIRGLGVCVGICLELAVLAGVIARAAKTGR